MNKNSLKSFAIEARKELREKIENKLNILGITKNKIEKVTDLGNQIENNGNRYSKKSYNDLVEKYSILGFEQLLEESAYTWFNRLVALAYMEINNYIEDKMVFNTDKYYPTILDEYYKAEFFEHLSFERKEEIETLKDKGTKEDLEKLYAILVEEKCKELSKIMPFMFSDEAEEYKQLVFPKNLLSENSFLGKLRKELNDAKDENNIVPIELIGWLYQFYNSEKKDEVFEGLKKNQKITKENIPAATQLFTPDWIVKYMVENSLGRLADENFEIRKEIKNNWKYYIESEKTENSEKIKIEDIKIIDPAMGSGHMLTYAFDLLFEIYEELGWSKKEAVLSILKNNLYGLEIDERAAQLASFAILMKAREKFPRIFRSLETLEEDEKFVFNTLSIEESNSISEATRKLLKANLLALLSNFEDAKEYGSILKIENLDIERLKDELREVKEKFKSEQKISLFNEEEDFNKIERLIKQYEIMKSKYDVTITNPPYMGGKGFSPKLKTYVEKNYKDTKSDLFAVFIERCNEFTKKNCYTSMITMQSWMFLSSFETLRTKLIEETEIQSLNHLGARAFSEIGGEVVQTVAWISKNKNPEIKGEYIRLVDYNNADLKEEEYFNKKNRFQANQKDFEKIPGSPIAYWVSDKVREIYKNPKIGEIIIPRHGLATSDNDRFLKVWSEINLNKGNFYEKLNFTKKWFIMNKGGSSRKWYGNMEWVINYENDGKEIKEFAISLYKSSSRTIQNTAFYFKEGITWNALTSSDISFRWHNVGAIFGSGAHSAFTEDKNILIYGLAIMNSKVKNIFLDIVSPTINKNVDNIRSVPFKINKIEFVCTLVKFNISIAKEEWDSRETSWDFKGLALLNAPTLKEAYKNYCSYWTEQFIQMHKNEEELNKIFIEIYELQDEMDEKVAFEDITLLKKEANIEYNQNSSYEYLKERGVDIVFNKEELIKQFLSYAVGCIMGRYSIDKEGLIIANSDDKLELSENKFIVRGEEGIRHEILNPRFSPEEFGIISFTEEEVFENDIVKKVIDFLKAAYGEENLSENLDFIAKALGGKENDSPKETLRAYFIKDFYKDHLQRYQKRPIYWLMNSGNKNAFSSLIYLHRYEPNTVARVRTDYLLEYQEKMIKQKEYYERELTDENLSPRDKKQAEKRLKELDNILKELKDYANAVKHIAEQKIALDLDDGVKVNYEKLGSVLRGI